MLIIPTYVVFDKKLTFLTVQEITPGSACLILLTKAILEHREDYVTLFENL